MAPFLTILSHIPFPAPLSRPHTVVLFSLARMPASEHCANPACLNKEAITMARIGGPWCTDGDRRVLDDLHRNMCSGCRGVHYCSVTCQRVHWKDHKAVCRGSSSSPASSKGRMFAGVKVVGVDDDEEEAIQAVHAFVADQPEEANRLIAQTGATRSGLMSALGNNVLIRTARDLARRQLNEIKEAPFTFVMDLIGNVLRFGIMLFIIYVAYCYNGLSDDQKRMIHRELQKTIDDHAQTVIHLLDE